MGIYDRPWYREDPTRRAPMLCPGTKWLVVVNAVAFVLTLFSREYLRWDPVGQGLGLVPDDVVGRFHVWQLVTSLFLHGSWLHLFFNMMVLWMFGSHVEQALGTGRYLRFYFFAGLCASVAYVVLGILPAPHERAVAVGASGAIMGVVVWFSLRNPDAVIHLFFVFPMKMKVAMWLLLGIDVYGFVFAGAGGPQIAHSAHLGGAMFGFLYFHYAAAFDRLFHRLSENGPRRRPEPERDPRVQAEVDRLLEKIHEGGIDSLSLEERDYLRDASRRLRRGER